VINTKNRKKEDIMKASKTILIVAVAFAFGFGLAPKTWAGGSSVGSACTLANNPGPGTVALRGTAAAEAHHVDSTAGVVSDVDLILRLTRSGVTKIFRVHDVTNNFAGATNEDVICTFISGSLKSDILVAFSIPSNYNLFLTASSISNATDPDFIPGTSQGRISGIADVTIYALKP
jgi:hypothetical protein